MTLSVSPYSFLINYFGHQTSPLSYSLAFESLKMPYPEPHCPSIVHLHQPHHPIVDQKYSSSPPFSSRRRQSFPSKMPFSASSHLETVPYPAPHCSSSAHLYPPHFPDSDQMYFCEEIGDSIMAP